VSKLNWEEVRPNSILTRNVVSEFKMGGRRIAHVIDEAIFHEFEWAAFGERGVAHSLEEAQGQAESVIAREAMKLLTDLGLLSKNERW